MNTREIYPIRFSKNNPKMHHRSENGQSFAEFALVVPLFLVLLIFLINFAHFAFFFVSLRAGANSASRYAAVASQTVSGVAQFRDCESIRSVAMSQAPLTFVRREDISIRYVTPDGAELIGICPSGQVMAGHAVEVEMVAYYRPLVEVIRFPEIPLRVVSRSVITMNVPVR